MKPKTNESVKEILRDLANELNDSVARSQVCMVALGSLKSHLDSVPRSPDNPDPDFFFATGDPQLPETRPVADWKLSRLFREIASDGAVVNQLSQQWIVFFYAKWEDHFRKRLAAAHGCKPEQVLVPLFGDLRRIRNDVVHAQGFASAEHTGRCEVLSHWFEVGDEITFSAWQHREFESLIPWQVLTDGPAPALG